MQVLVLARGTAGGDRSGPTVRLGNERGPGNHGGHLPTLWLGTGIVVGEVAGAATKNDLVVPWPSSGPMMTPVMLTVGLRRAGQFKGVVLLT